MPTVTFVTDAFVSLAKRVATSLDLPLPLLRTHTLPHAIASLDQQAAAKVLQQTLPQLEEQIYGSVAEEKELATKQESTAIQLERIAYNGSYEEALEIFSSRGWVDGLPIVVPTEERVERMLGALASRRYTVLGRVPPKGTPLTLESLAVNAVLAGCEPGYFPAVIGAARAVLEPKFNLLGVNTTTNASSPLLIAGGPVAAQAGLQSGLDVLGPYHRPNVTIGRAIRLVMIGVGDCRPGDGDMATQGQSMKVGCCITENPESPWEPLHVELGCAPEESAVTAVAATGQLNLLDFSSRNAKDLLRNFGRSMSMPALQNAQIGAGPVIIFGIEHAKMLADGGYSKADVKHWLFENTRIPLETFGEDTVRDVINVRRPQWVSKETNPSGMVPMADAWSDFTILVAGGPGAHSVLLPTFLGPRPVMVKTGRDGLG